ncbi:hypothetical protein [Herbaspirillum huttiense]|uniref:hypothetical protein n=1 Tax=Herbaspirillum huttiense TaxID=863372 RepID=UPI0031D7220C
MLSKRQWQWCADHELGIKLVLLYFFQVFVLVYSYNFLRVLRVFWWENKVPMPLYTKGSLIEKLKCFDGESREFFIDGNPDKEPLARVDASFLLLEKHDTTIFGSEVLHKRPVCLGAYINFTAGLNEPHAIYVVDRKTGKSVFRIAYLRDYLKR